MAKRIKLTKAIIEALDHEDHGQWVTDTEVPQLVLRLTPTSKTFVARWTSKTVVDAKGKRKRRQEHIGTVDEISVTEARERARRFVAEDRPREVETLTDIYQIWSDHYASIKGEDHADEIRRTWKKHIEPDLGKTKLNMLSHATLQAWYHKKRNEHPVSAKGKVRAKPYTASTVNRWIAYISKFCTIARKHGHMVGNPVEGLERSKPKRRLDVFVREDLITLGNNLNAVENRYPIAVSLFRFLMIFPCRGIEAREMEWADLDLEAGAWTIPAERYKTDTDKVFPIGPLQIQHLRGLPKWSTQYVFPRPSTTGVGSSRKTAPDVDLPVTKNHQIYVWKKVRPKPLGAHALRRSIATWLLNNAVPLEMVSKLLGHSTTLVTQQAYAHLEPQTAGKYLMGWTKFLEDETPKKDDYVDPILAAEAKIMVERYNDSMTE